MGSARFGKWWTAPLLVFVAGAALGQQPSLTLREAIDQALGRSPQTAEASADVRAADAAAGMARTALLPRLSATEDISRGDDPVYVFGSRLRQQEFTQSDFSLNSLNRPAPINNFATRLSGQWMLFDWFATEKRIRGARLAAAGANSMTGAASQRVVLQVVQGYQAVLYAQRQADLARSEQETAEALLRDAQSRVKAGTAIESDLLAAQVNLAERQQDRIAAEGGVDDAWAALEAAMGGGFAVRPALTPMQAKSFPDGDLDQDIQAALRARPDLKALQQQSASQQQAVKAARSDFLPRVSAYGDWEMDRQTFAGSGGDNWVAGAQLNLDLLPLGKRARLEEAQAADRKLAAQEQAVELEIRLAVNRAFTGHQTAERMVVTAQASMEQSAEGLRILRNRYDAGLATMTDLLRAEDAQRRSRNDYWRAAYGNAVAYAELLYATGQITPDSAENLQ